MLPKQVRRSFFTVRLLHVLPRGGKCMDSLNLNAWQRRRLRRQLRATHDARLYRRTLAILEVDRGRSVRDVALSLGVEPRTIYYWIEAYTREHDPSSLGDGERPGRPTLWTGWLDRRLRTAM